MVERLHAEAPPGQFPVFRGPLPGMNQRLFGLLLAGSIACATTEAPNANGARSSDTVIVFNYPQSADFSALVAEYSERLGPPVQHEKRSDVEAAERVVWQDAETRFELTRDPKRSVSTIYSRRSVLP
jgi:hypothetical protein